MERLCGLLIVLLFFLHVVAAQQAAQNGPQVDITNLTARTALLWTSIGVAVITSLLQGLITTIVQIAEDQGLWTYRFRIARLEHWWWTAVSILLSVSVGFIIIAFLAGNSENALGVLVLSTATTIAVVRFAIPAWRNRVFIENRWLAWTGPSRTSIAGVYKDLCGDAAQWKRLYKEHSNRKMPSPAPSDLWGHALFPPGGLSQDPTAILGTYGEDMGTFRYVNGDYPCVYDDGGIGDGNVSLKWGEDEGFRRRVSRAVNAMPIGLLKSRPATVDGYNGEGLCLAFGIMGRNKGLQPAMLRFDASDAWKRSRGIQRTKSESRLHAILENTSAWSPRPNKVMRSYYARAVDEQYGTLPADYTAAATELALILLDIRQKELRIWLSGRFEQQAIDVNRYLSGRGVPVMRATDAQLKTLYRASYTSMIISLNYLQTSARSTVTKTSFRTAVRPDLTCFALLWLAEHVVERRPETGEWQEGPGVDMPGWWDNAWVRDRLKSEQESLKIGWKDPTAWLLGLKEFPSELEFDHHPRWPVIRYRSDQGVIQRFQAEMASKLPA